MAVFDLLRRELLQKLTHVSEVPTAFITKAILKKYRILFSSSKADVMLAKCEPKLGCTLQEVTGEAHGGQLYV